MTPAEITIVMGISIAALSLMPETIIPPLPDIEAVAEETSGREVNKMLRSGWRLLLVTANCDSGGSYPCYILGKPRVTTHHPDAAPVDARA